MLRLAPCQLLQNGRRPHKEPIELVRALVGHKLQRHECLFAEASE